MERWNSSVAQWKGKVKVFKDDVDGDGDDDDDDQC